MMNSIEMRVRNALGIQEGHRRYLQRRALSSLEKPIFLPGIVIDKSSDVLVVESPGSGN